jgi:hypothetical protein
MRVGVAKDDVFLRNTVVHRIGVGLGVAQEEQVVKACHAALMLVAICVCLGKVELEEVLLRETLLVKGGCAGDGYVTAGQGIGCRVPPYLLELTFLRYAFVVRRKSHDVRRYTTRVVYLRI